MLSHRAEILVVTSIINWIQNILSTIKLILVSLLQLLPFLIVVKCVVFYVVVAAHLITLSII